MIKFRKIAPCALSILMALVATFLPYKSINVSAVDEKSPPSCKEGYEYVEVVGKCYKKCADGWERNSETLRCRKLRTEEGSSASSSAPSDTASSAASSDSADSSAASGSSSSTPPSSPSKETASSSNASKATTCKDGYEYIASAGKCYKQCADGWERNPETNRCKKATVESDYEVDTGSSQTKSTDTPPSCKEGYEYVASAGKCYKACAEGQVRNPETNRCKKATADGASTESSTDQSSTATCKDGYEYVASAGKCYKKCGENQERNPETNRCRKVTTGSTSQDSAKKTNDGAAYEVDVPNTGGASSFVATGSIIALIAAGLAFVGFQYRTEIKQFLKKHMKKSPNS